MSQIGFIGQSLHKFCIVPAVFAEPFVIMSSSIQMMHTFFWGVTKTSNRVTSNGVTGKRVTARNTEGKFMRKRVTAKNTDRKFSRKRVTN